jgi:hypothetical protein
MCALLTSARVKESRKSVLLLVVEVQTKTIFAKKVDHGANMAASDSPQARSFFQSLNQRKLTLEQVQHIDKALASLGEYGEVHLVIQHGELRYINRLESQRAWKSDQVGK